MNRKLISSFQYTARTIIRALVLILIPVYAFAGRNVGALPHEEHFDADNYSDIVWVTQGATHTWMPDAGWRGGAAKFTPVLNVEGYSGLGQFNNLRGQLNGPVTQLNVRWLVYHGSTWQEYGPNNKVLINVRTSGSRPMIIARDHEDYVTWGACDGTVCRYEGGDYWPDGSDSFRVGNRPDNRELEWISVELESNSATGTLKLFIHTQDGEMSGLYVERSIPVGGTWDYVDILGGYMSEAVQSDPNNYFLIDEVKIDTSYIGPPEGFLENPPPPTPAPRPLGNLVAE